MTEVIVTDITLDAAADDEIPSRPMIYGLPGCGKIHPVKYMDG